MDNITADTPSPRPTQTLAPPPLCVLVSFRSFQPPCSTWTGSACQRTWYPTPTPCSSLTAASTWRRRISGRGKLARSLPLRRITWSPPAGSTPVSGCDARSIGGRCVVDLDCRDDNSGEPPNAQCSAHASGVLHEHCCGRDSAAPLPRPTTDTQINVTSLSDGESVWHRL